MPLALPLVLLLSACGGSPTEPVGLGDPSTAASVPASAPSPRLGDGGRSAGSPTPGSPTPGSPTSGRPAAPGASAAPGPSSPAPLAGPTSAPAARGAAPRPAAPTSLATRAGRYTYDSRGTVTAGGAPRTVSGTATLTVDPPTGDTQSAVLEGDQGRTETESVLRADGRYLARLLLTTPAFSKEFAASPPVLLLPEGAPVGRTWSFTVRSTDGKTTATARNRVLRSERVTVGGRAVDTRVVETVLALRGDVVYDGTTTSNYAPAQRLAVKERGRGKGTVSGVAFSTDTTSALRSLDPA